MKKINEFLSTLFFTLAILLGLNILLTFFEINLGLENKYLIWPLAVFGSILFFHFVGDFIIHGPENINKINRFLKNSFSSLSSTLSNIIKIKLIKFGLLPILLFLAGITASTLFMLLQGEMRSVLIKRHPNKAFVDYQADEFTAGSVAAAVFKADDNNLGIVGLKFKTYNRINGDVLEFRLKEEAKRDWIYVNQYKTDQFQNEQFFPFGFPKIPDSAGKTYLFEVESLNGREDNAVGLSKSGKVIESRYQFNLKKLKTNPPMLIRFLYKKIFFSLGRLDFWLASIIYLLPFYAYIFYLIFSKKLTSFFSTIKDYFTLGLIVYLISEFIVQTIRLGSQFNWWTAEPTNFQSTANILLSLTITLGLITAVSKTPSSS